MRRQKGGGLGELGLKLCGGSFTLMFAAWGGSQTGFTQDCWPEAALCDLASQNTVTSGF